MTVPAPEGAPPINHRWIAQPGDVGRLASAMTRGAFTNRRFAIRLAVALLIFIAVVAVLIALGDVTFAVYALVILALMIVITPIRTNRQTRNRLRRIAFPGAEWAIGYGPTSLVICDPTASAVISYSTFASATRGHNATAVLKYANSPLIMVVPGELCPPEALAFLQTAIARYRTI